MLGAVLLFFWRAAFTHEVFFRGDIAYLFMPLRLFASHCLRRGELPLWCPLVLCGFPLEADGAVGLFYPLNFPSFLAGNAAAAHKWLVVFHYFLAAAGTYAFARRLSLRPLSSFGAAVTFAFSGYMVTHLLHVNLIEGASLLPWLLFLCAGTLRRQRSGWANWVGVGLVLGLQLLTGHPQLACYSFLAVIVFLWFFRPRRLLEGKARWLWTRTAGRIALVLVSALLISAAQVIPMMEGARLSERAGGGSSLSISYAWGWVHLLTLLLPNLFGSPAHGTYVGPPFHWELCGYVGLVPLLFLATVPLLRRTRWMRVFVTLAVLGLLLSVGTGNPLYSLLGKVPPFSLFRAPSRALVLFSFAAALVTGFGLNLLTDPHTHTRSLFCRRLWVAALVLTAGGIVIVLATTNVAVRSVTHDLLALAIICTAMAGIAALSRGTHLANAPVQALVLLLVGADLARFGFGYNRTISPDFYRRPPLTARVLAADRAQFRVYTFDTRQYEAEKCTATSESGEPGSQFNLRETLLFNAGALWGVPAVHGVSQLFLSSQLRTFRRMRDGLSRDNGSATSAKLLGEMNGKYVITSRTLRCPPFRLIDKTIVPVYENLEWRPRCTFRSGKGLVSLRSSPIAESWEVTSSQRSDLLIRENFYPGWRATVDGQPTPLEVSVYGYRRMFVPSGRHRVELVFFPASLRLGLWMTLLALTGLGVLVGKRGHPRSSR